MPFPGLPERIRTQIEAVAPGFYTWLRDLKSFVETTLATKGDVRVETAGKGILMTNSAGTITKRVRLNNTGDGLLYEDE